MQPTLSHWAFHPDEPSCDIPVPPSGWKSRITGTGELPVYPVGTCTMKVRESPDEVIVSLLSPAFSADEAGQVPVPPLPPPPEPVAPPEPVLPPEPLPPPPALPPLPVVPPEPVVPPLPVTPPVPPPIVPPLPVEPPLALPPVPVVPPVETEPPVPVVPPAPVVPPVPVVPPLPVVPPFPVEPPVPVVPPAPLLPPSPVLPPPEAPQAPNRRTIDAVASERAAPEDALRNEIMITSEDGAPAWEQTSGPRTQHTLDTTGDARLTDAVRQRRSRTHPPSGDGPDKRLYLRMQERGRFDHTIVIGARA